MLTANADLARRVSVIAITLTSWPARTCRVWSICLRCAALAWAWTASPLAAAPAGPAGIDPLFEQWAHARSPGVSVAVVSADRVTLQKAVGYANLENDVAITPESVFHIASLSKQFTAMAVLLLQDRGQLKLDDRVAQYLPQVVPEVAANITLRELMYHTSGLRDQNELSQLAGRTAADVLRQEDVLALVARQRRLNFAPGTEFLYSNTGYTLLAAVVEKVTGTPFADWTRREIFLPLGMRHTRFVDDYTAVIEHAVESYHVDSRGISHRAPLNLGTVGPTGAVSTANDLATWARFVMSGSRGGLHVPSEYYEHGHLLDGSAISYGAGLFVERYRSRRLLEHGGSDAAFRAYLMMFPDERNAVILLANTDGAQLPALARQVADRMFGLDAGAATAGDHRPTSAPDCRPYAGQYAMQDGSIINVDAAGGGCSVGTGGSALPLRWTRDDSFTVGDSEVVVEFSNPADDGQRTSLTVINSGVSVPGRRVTMQAPPAGMLAALGGTYYCPEVDRFLEIAVDGPGLHLILPDGTRLPMSYLGDSTFRSLAVTATLTFDRGADGAVHGASLSGARVRNVELIRAERPSRQPGS